MYVLFLTELRGDSWRVARVLKSDELGRPYERLREQMLKLGLSPQEGEHTLNGMLIAVHCIKGYVIVVARLPRLFHVYAILLSAYVKGLDM